MTDTRAELEATIWRQVTRARSLATTISHAVDMILAAADKHATAEAAVISRRLRAIDIPLQPKLPAVHWLNGAKVACGQKNQDVVNTTVRGRVTCSHCKNTRAWKDAAA